MAFFVDSLPTSHFKGIPIIALKRQKRKKLATLADVAKKLGVSKATVSLVISDHQRISQQTKARVWKCIRQLDYRPDPVARALITGRSNLIGLIVPDTSNSFYADVFRGAEDAARERGYHILLNNGSYQLDAEEKRLGELLELKVAGLIVSPPLTNVHQISRPMWARLREQQFPLVLLNRDVKPGIFHQISPDNVEGIRLSTELLAQLGHKRVAYISGTPNILPVRQRLSAYQKYAVRYGFEQDACLMEVSPFTAQGGYEAAQRLWQGCRRRPTAIMALTDLVATGVLKFLSEAKVKVPEDVSVMGFDGFPESEFSLIGITTIAVPMFEMGRKAVEMLEQAIGQPSGAPQTTTMPVHLIQRESTGPAKSRPRAARTG